MATRKKAVGERFRDVHSVADLVPLVAHMQRAAPEIKRERPRLVTAEGIEQQRKKAARFSAGLVLWRELAPGVRAEIATMMGRRLAAEQNAIELERIAQHLDRAELELREARSLSMTALEQRVAGAAILPAGALPVIVECIDQLLRGFLKPNLAILPERAAAMDRRAGVSSSSGARRGASSAAWKRHAAEEGISHARRWTGLALALAGAKWTDELRAEAGKKLADYLAAVAQVNEFEAGNWTELRKRWRKIVKETWVE